VLCSLVLGTNIALFCLIRNDPRLKRHRLVPMALKRSTGPAICINRLVYLGITTDFVSITDDSIVNCLVLAVPAGDDDVCGSQGGGGAGRHEDTHGGGGGVEGLPSFLVLPSSISFFVGMTYRINRERVSPSRKFIAATEMQKLFS
jgi:hypothetical protein